MSRTMQRHVIVPLDEWINDIQDSDLGASWAREQATYIRRHIAPLFIRAVELPERLASVSEHQSMSTILPVYHIKIADVGWVQFRGNGYNWIITCHLNISIPNRFGTLFDPTNKVLEVHAEGFKGHDVWGSFSENQRWFTVDIGPRSEHLYTFMFILRTTLQELGVDFSN